MSLHGNSARHYCNTQFKTHRMKIVNVGRNKRVWVASQFDVRVVSNDFCVTAIIYPLACTLRLCSTKIEIEKEKESQMVA